MTARPVRRRTALTAVGAGAAVLGLGALGRPRPPRPGARRTGDAELAGRLAAICAGTAVGNVTAAVVTPDGERFAGLGADRHTEVEIGSVTKTTTAFLLARSAALGAVSLDDPVRDHLDVGAGDYTLLDLATHRSGLPRLDPRPAAVGRMVLSNFLRTDPYAADGPEDVVAAARSVGRTERGEVSYSNLGVALLGQALASATGSAWDELLRSRLLRPLGMDATTAPLSAARLRAGAPHGRTSTGRPADPWTMAGWAPAGGIRSTAADMARYVRAVLDDALPGVAAGELLEPRFDAGDGRRIGLAWFSTPYRGRTVTWHNGGTGGYATMLALDRAARTGVFVATDVAADVDAIGFRLLTELAS
ncbi:serine hydrolase domain-containing protein [Curtobacterium sp. L1-20]|uniref:serine hydrolase domain-containing protein n=1 Tax=Curtobacterium sp. L1-20 TaxID=3138181 RepID=UPI003B51DA5F